MAKPNADRAAAAVAEAVLGKEGRVDTLRRLAAMTHGAAAAGGDPEAEALGDLDAAAPLADKVARHAYRIDQDDIDRARAAGWSDDDLFELILSAAVGAGMGRRSIGRAAVDRWERSR